MAKKTPTPPVTPKAKPLAKPKTKKAPSKLPPKPEHELEGGYKLSDALTDRQKLFVIEYTRCWNATEAARRAKYKDPECSGYENRQKPAIQAAIQHKIEERAMGRDEVLSRLADQARGVPREFWQFFDPSMTPEELKELKEELEDAGIDTSGIPSGRDNLRQRLQRVTPYLNMPALLASDYGHLIKKFKIQNGQIEVEFYDAQAALTLIGRHLKMFTDKVEATISLDTPINNDDLNPLEGLGRDEVNRRIAEKLKSPRSR